MSDSKKHKVSKESAVTDNNWQVLKQYTDARIGLGRAGPCQTTKDLLAFQLAHARAQDAVNTPVDWSVLHHELKNYSSVQHLHSLAKDRATYLQRPDLGRRLDESSVKALKSWRDSHKKALELCIVVADGLSATAIETQALPMLKQLQKDLQTSEFSCPLVCFVDQARVAIGDDIAENLNAELTLVLIGERPGLSSPNSLGVYFTYQAKKGFNDAKRNCISNVRPEGLSFSEASQRLIWLMNQARKRNLSGIELKDDSQLEAIIKSDKQSNFLTTD